MPAKRPSAKQRLDAAVHGYAIAWAAAAVQCRDGHSGAWRAYRRALRALLTEERAKCAIAAHAVVLKGGSQMFMADQVLAAIAKIGRRK